MKQVCLRNVPPSGSWLLVCWVARMLMNGEPSLLEAHDVTKRYERRDGSTFNAVDGVSLSISPAETVALVGETGSGKSTLARLALGLTAPDEGDICFRGKALDRMSGAEHHKFRLAVQPIFQDPGASFNPRRKVKDLLRQAFVQAGRPRDDIPAATSAVLAQAPLVTRNVKDFERVPGLEVLTY